MPKESNAETLYVRGVNKSTDEIEDIWDDTILNNAYDKALKMANAEVAKRIAMETNSKKKKKIEKGNVEGLKETSTSLLRAEPKPKDKYETFAPTPSSPEEITEWKAGMPCRAIYDHNGQEYEAFLVKLVNDTDCIVKFLGYEYSEQVEISSLKPTLGNEERMKQVKEALVKRDEDGFQSLPGSESAEGPSDAPSSELSGKSNKKKKNNNKKKRNPRAGIELGDLPSMPNMNMFRQMGANMPILMPPPPIAALSHRTDEEEQAISDMLLSWYMTGYYTGLYQQKRAERRGRRH